MVSNVCPTRKSIIVKIMNTTEILKILPQLSNSDLLKI